MVIVVPMIGFGESFDQALKFWFMLLTAAMVAYSLGAYRMLCRHVILYNIECCI